MLPYHFGTNFHAAKVDYADAVIIYLLVVLSVCFLLGVPGPGLKQRLKTFLWALITLAVGFAIVAMQVTRKWETTEGIVNVSLADPSSDHPHRLQQRFVLIRIDVGLTGLNVTYSDLTPHEYNTTEPFHFNEEFDWAWAQGRDGFGPYAGPYNQQFRKGQRYGLPHAVLYAADYLTHDGEGFRFGRWYRYGGWYAHYVIWLALATWIAANICLQFSPVSAAQMWGATGALLIAAAVIWACYTPALRPFHPIFRYGDTDLHLQFGASFWCCIAAGILSLIIGSVIFGLDARHPHLLTNFFGLDPLTGYDECYCSPNGTETTNSPRLSPWGPMLGYDNKAMELESPTEPNAINRVRPQVELRRKHTTRLHSREYNVLRHNPLQSVNWTKSLPM